MGYTTDFSGQFELDKPLAPEHLEYLVAFNETRRMRRNPELADKISDPVRIKAKLPIGIDGAYFVAGNGFKGQGNDASVTGHNDPPRNQPGLWCQWVPSENGDAIVWDEGEKFYDYTEWLEYIIEHFLDPWGYKLNGEVKWLGEDPDDQGRITVKDNIVTTKTLESSLEDGEKAIDLVRELAGMDTDDDFREIIAKAKHLIKRDDTTND